MISYFSGVRHENNGAACRVVSLWHGEKCLALYLC